ncbi:MAG TPA: hypothetical protein VMS94_03160 [Acidobacteriota bacterium]|nr:hypothetical protein [Acidobacteriota bacterium]
MPKIGKRVHEAKQIVESCLDCVCTAPAPESYMIFRKRKWHETSGPRQSKSGLGEI